ncbi:hypothetical protein [Paenibacillus tyrfis]|uniref:hypothetical protein n=1 Tax=Paenibacillus tyrfis TaxID=1501230 RepID=UPI0020A04FF1|nr:hypothetical protein [Paenibacillus tyrfis]MCP1306070.1 hypothetical protein [Paenibacillus tyrfis]
MSIDDEICRLSGFQQPKKKKRPIDYLFFSYTADRLGEHFFKYLTFFNAKKAAEGIVRYPFRQLFELLAGGYHPEV